MKVWPVHDARAKFSELLQAAEYEGPQIITEQGVEMVVVVSAEEWKRLTEKQRLPDTRPSLRELLLTDPRRFELDVPARGQLKHRAPPVIE